MPLGRCQLDGMRPAGVGRGRPEALPKSCTRTLAGLMKFAEHRAAHSLSRVLSDGHFIVGDSYGFKLDALPEVVRGLLSWLRPRACEFQLVDPLQKNMHFSAYLHWCGFYMTEEEMETVAAQTVFVTVLQLRYVSALSD